MDTQHHVGDQNRVENSHLTALNFPLKREFKTQTGLFKRISDINRNRSYIDIVINELDAFNIDLETRKPRNADFTKYYPNWNLWLFAS
jgi:hypothetical protein